jgi:hypothetical protein
MQTLVHRPARFLGRAPQRLTMWLLGAVLVALVAATLALSLGGSGPQRTDPSADGPHGAPQAQAPLGRPLP